MVRSFKEEGVDGGMSGSDRLIEYVTNNSKANGLDYVFAEKREPTICHDKVGYLDPGYLQNYEETDGILFMVQSYPERYCVDLPGGKRDFGESSWDCCVREVLEETGWNVEGLNEVRECRQDNAHRWFFFRIEEHE